MLGNCKKILLYTFFDIWQRIARINDRLFRGGADFSGWMSTEEAGLMDWQGNMYQPSTGALVKVLKKFQITEEDAIIDIGCGKGKAMYLMSRFPFGKIRGYDLSRRLVDIANRNFESLNLRQCHAVRADAAAFTDYDEYTYFYLFNPFSQEIFEIMMRHILESVKRKPRICRLIYLNPECHDYILDHTPFRLIYKSRSAMLNFSYYCYKIG